MIFDTSFALALLEGDEGAVEKTKLEQDDVPLKLRRRPSWSSTSGSAPMSARKRNAGSDG